jgi:hypothetical protein
MKDKIHSAIKNSGQETSRFVTAHVRDEARNSNWPDQIARSMSVTYGKNGFEAHTHKNHVEKVKDLEYGTPSTRPTAAIRRSANRTHEAESFFVQRLAKHLGEL